MKRKKYWFLFAILLLSLSSLSPSFDFTHNTRREPPGDDPVPPQQRPEIPESDLGPIKVGVQLEPDQIVALSKLNEHFMDETGARVEIIPFASETQDKDSFLLHMTLGDGPDILLTDSHYIKALAMNGYLMPVDSSQSVVTGGEIINGLLSPLQWNGYQWGVPFDMDPYVMVREQKHKDGSAFEMPIDHASWLDLFEAYEDEAQTPLISFDLHDPYAFGAAVHLLEGNPSLPEEEVLDLLLRNAEVSAPETDDAEQQSKDVNPGKSPIVIGPYSRIEAKDLSDSSYGLATGQAHLNTPVVRTRSLAVSAHTESSALAMKWIAYMTSKEIEQQWSQSVGTLPVISELFVNSSMIGDTGLWQAAALPIQLLLTRNEAAVLEFGNTEGLTTYKNFATRLLEGRITKEEYMELYRIEEAK